MKKTKSRGNGEGSIYYREKMKLWAFQYPVGIDEKGKIKRKTVYGKTKREVIEKSKKMISYYQDNPFIDKADMKLRDIAIPMLEDEFRLNKIAPITYLRKKCIFNIIENHYISDIPIQKIKECDIKNFFEFITKYSNSVISKECSFLNRLLTIAVKRKIINYNILENSLELSKPKSLKENKKISAFSLEEQQKIIEIISKEDTNFKYTEQILLSMFTGMRMGEINALTLDDIDLKNKIIHISKTITKNEKDISILGRKGKTINATRDIKINNQVEFLLKNYIENKYRDNSYNLIFYNEKIISTAQVNSAFKRFCEKYNINKGFNVNQHMLRHTFATRCIEAGVPAKVLQKIMGHSNIKTTLQIYTDIFDKFEQKYTDILEDYLYENKLNITK